MCKLEDVLSRGRRLNVQLCRSASRILCSAAVCRSREERERDTAISDWKQSGFGFTELYFTINP